MRSYNYLNKFYFPVSILNINIMLLVNYCFLARATDNTNDKEVNMEDASEQDTNKGKSGNKNPLAFLGLKNVLNNYANV